MMCCTLSVCVLLPVSGVCIYCVVNDVQLTACGTSGACGERAVQLVEVEVNLASALNSLRKMVALHVWAIALNHKSVPTFPVLVGVSLFSYCY
jgi:hypothetical protein